MKQWIQEQLENRRVRNEIMDSSASPVYQFVVNTLLFLAAALSFGYTLILFWDRATGPVAAAMAIILAVIIEGAKLVSNRELVYCIRAFDFGRGILALIVIIVMTGLSMICSAAFELKSNHVNGDAMVISGAINFDADREIQRLQQQREALQASVDSKAETKDAMPSNYSSRRAAVQAEIDGLNNQIAVIDEKISAREGEVVKQAEKAGENGLNFLFASLAESRGISVKAAENYFTAGLTLIIELLIFFFGVTSARFTQPSYPNKARPVSDQADQETPPTKRKPATPVVSQSPTPAPSYQSEKRTDANVQLTEAPYNERPPKPPTDKYNDYIWAVTDTGGYWTHIFTPEGERRAMAAIEANIKGQTAKNVELPEQPLVFQQFQRGGFPSPVTGAGAHTGGHPRTDADTRERVNTQGRGRTRAGADGRAQAQPNIRAQAGADTHTRAHVREVDPQLIRSYAEMMWQPIVLGCDITRRKDGRLQSNRVVCSGLRAAGRPIDTTVGNAIQSIFIDKNLIRIDGEVVYPLTDANTFFASI